MNPPNVWFQISDNYRSKHRFHQYIFKIIKFLSVYQIFKELFQSVKTWFYYRLQCNHLPFLNFLQFEMTFQYLERRKEIERMIEIKTNNRLHTSIACNKSTHNKFKPIWDTICAWLILRRQRNTVWHSEHALMHGRWVSLQCSFLGRIILWTHIRGRVVAKRKVEINANSFRLCELSKLSKTGCSLTDVVRVESLYRRCALLLSVHTSEYLCLYINLPSLKREVQIRRNLYFSRYCDKT